MDGTDDTREIVQPTLDAPPDAPTVFFDQPGPSLRPTYLALVFCAVAAAGFLVGIAVAAGSRPVPKTTGAVVADPVVGPSGATIRFDDGQIEIPQDALAQPTRITIRRSVFSDHVRVLPANGAPQVYNPGGLHAFTFGPQNIGFQRAVRIVFRLPAGARDGTIFARNGNDIVILGGRADPDRQTVTITVHDFAFARQGRT